MSIMMNNTLLHKDLGDGYYLEYREERNGLGGYHPVDIVLKNSHDPNCKFIVTNGHGDFVNFPGAEEGPWMKHVRGVFWQTVRFTFSVSKYVDGICYVTWLVQPDGRYYADDDGFGAEHDVEIELYSMMNQKGQFVCPFTAKYMDGCGKCYML